MHKNYKIFTIILPNIGQTYPIHGSEGYPKLGMILIFNLILDFQNNQKFKDGVL